MAKTTCRWCGKRHPEYSESYCYIKNEKRHRSRARPRVKSIAEVYDERGHLKPEFIHTDMEDKLMARQQQMAIDASLWAISQNGYKVPGNVGIFSNGEFIHGQVSNRRPWAVYALVDGKRRRKRFNNLFEAVRYHARVHKKYPSSGIVSLGKSYELPVRFRFTKEKLPKKFKWCPRCAAFRVFKRRQPTEKFYAMVKVWSEEKNRYVWKDREIWLTECQLCGLPNRDPIMRRENLPWEIRRIKPGVTRVKPRVRTQRARENKGRRVRR